MTDTVDSDAQRTEMVDRLVQDGALSGCWLAAFAAVPRHAFLPDIVWRHDRGAVGEADLVPLERSADPDTWMRTAYTDDAVITQVDDRAPSAVVGREATSSVSAPGTVARMLTAADLRPGARVLEIGTGSGYHAALLAHSLGPDAVTTIEIDPVLADRARTALSAAGFGQVEVLTGDGTHTLGRRPPFDRVIATAAVRDVPHAWLAHTRPGGLVVTPWTTTYRAGGLLTLTVGSDGSGAGRLGIDTSFMRVRSQRVPRFHPTRVGMGEGTTDVSLTDVHGSHLLGHRPAELAIGIRVPRCQPVYSPTDQCSGTLWLVDQWSRSWAGLAVEGTGPHEVRQAGPRRLFDEVAAAHQWWVDADRPDVTDWLVTVDEAGTAVELQPCS